MEYDGDLSLLCRLCLVKECVNTPIFEEPGAIRQIFHKITSCLPVKVEKDDDLPQSICDNCSSKLDMVYDFWNSSANAENQLLQWLNQSVATTENGATRLAIRKSEHIVKKEDVDDIYLHTNTWEEEAGPSATIVTEEQPPAKRARRAAAVKAALTVAQDSDDDDDDDCNDGPMTKMEDESDDDDPNYVDVPSPSADDQPGPSGVGKDDAVDAPWDDEDEEEALSEDNDSSYQCGICGEVFEDKERFLMHNVNILGLYCCCRCDAKFKTCNELYEHYNTHKMVDETFEGEQVDLTEEVVEGDVEELVLNYENEEEVIVQQAATSDAQELLYILDDSQCVNEVVIQEEEPVVEKKTDSRAIVNLEHGYMIPSEVLGEDEDKDDYMDDNINVIVNKRLSLPVKPSTSKKMVSQPKPRTAQPKRRHELPDFSASSYDYISPNEDIDVPHYKCLRCEQLFINKLVFFRHIEKGKCFINNCDVCSATFNKNQDFYLHYVTHHTDRAICNFCFRTFMYEKNVKEHMLRHLDQFRHRCEACNKGFYTVREYRNHYKNRHMGIRHKCGVCGRSFADEYYFKRHLATHAKGSITLLQLNE